VFHDGEQRLVPGRIMTGALGCGDHLTLEGDDRLAAHDRVLGIVQDLLVDLPGEGRLG
jgi:hypothetical protein